MIHLKKFNEEVLTATDPLVEIGRADVDTLKRQSLANTRRRIRICTHPDTADLLHEMFIVHARGAYVRPHKHLNKSEAVHVIEGEADVVFFDDSGTVTEVVRLGDYDSGRTFYYRVGAPRHHTLLITSEFLVFHEITNGPFRREDTIFPTWAPEESDPVACLAFQQRLGASIRTTL